LRLCGYEHQRGNGKIARDNIMSRCQSSTKLADVARSTFVVGNLRLLRMMMAPSGGHAAGTLRLRTRAGKRKRAPEMVSCAALENSTKSAEEFIDEKYGRIEKTNPRSS